MGILAQLRPLTSFSGKSFVQVSRMRLMASRWPPCIGCKADGIYLPEVVDRAAVASLNAPSVVSPVETSL